MPESDPVSTFKGSPLMRQVRQTMRVMHVAKRTEEAYISWIARYLIFHRDRRGEWTHPTLLGSDGINEFLTYLAVERRVAASTQNQALSALLFLYSKTLKSDIQIDAIRAKRPSKLPVVLSPSEVAKILSYVQPKPKHLMCSLDGFPRTRTQCNGTRTRTRKYANDRANLRPRTTRRLSTCDRIRIIDLSNREIT